MASKSPSELYAEAVADLCWRLPAATRSDRGALAALFEEGYRSHKARLAEGGSEEDRMGAAVFAAGLFALGQLDLASEVLAMPETRGQVGNLRRVVRAMLPIDEPAPSDTELIAFIDAHRDALKFDPISGTYRVDPGTGTNLGVMRRL